MPSTIMNIRKAFGHVPTAEEITHNASRRIRLIESQQPELAKVLRAALKEVERSYLFLSWSSDTNLLRRHVIHWAEVTSKRIKVFARTLSMDGARGLLNELGKMHLVFRLEKELPSSLLNKMVHRIDFSTTLTEVSKHLFNEATIPINTSPLPLFTKSDDSVMQSALDILFGREEISRELLFEAGKLFDKEGDRNWLSLDQERALSLYEKCGSYIPAMKRRGEIYFEKANSSLVNSKKHELWKVASDLGHIEATYLLATSISDKKESIRLLTKIPLNDRKTFPAYHFEMFLLKMDDEGEDNYKAAQAYLTGDFEGNKVRKNVPLGIDYLKKAAEQGYIPANMELGRRCHEGDGVVKNLNLALTYYEKHPSTPWVLIIKAELSGDSNALREYALNFARGQNGLELDVNKAFKYLKLSADLGNWVAQFELGSVYAGSQYFEKTLLSQPDYNQAKLYLSSACNSSNNRQPLYPNALAWLAVCYRELNEMELHAKYAKMSADLGDRAGQYYLAYCYYRGSGGTPRDNQKALHYFKLAKTGGIFVQDCNERIQYLEETLRPPVPQQTTYSQPTYNQPRNYLNSPPLSGGGFDGVEMFGNALNTMQTSFENNLNNFSEFRRDLYTYDGGGQVPMFIPPPFQDFGGGF